MQIEDYILVACKSEYGAERVRLRRVKLYKKVYAARIPVREVKFMIFENKKWEKRFFCSLTQ